MGEAVTYEVVDKVAHVTIRRPEKKNAMSLEVFDLLGEHARRAGHDDTVGAVLVAGEGGTFSSGIDVSVFGDQLGNGVEPAFIARLQGAFTAFEELDKPTIAAIEGYCFGGGIQLAIACHLRAVAPSAQLAVKEADWGLVPDLGGTWRLPRLVGLGRATELTLTARTVGADEARAIGLAEFALDDDPQGEAHDLAARLAAGPGALRRAPRLLRENLGRDRDDALSAEAAAQVACIGGHDFTEAVTARLQGRAPHFTGT
ncbi:MAG TPA: enoyl-CoA hydratase-related protein [Egicoccus sp.]|nr:enoyl-CoA hydratase-related protein [Egicoccus sp.]HSK22339.1 enoyl-CoA hydratase-related protein [Egicoccus sp.]